MKIKSKLILILSICSILLACSPSDSAEPKEVVLTYGESSVSAQINEGSVFEGSKDTEMEKVAFSGAIQKQGTSYLVDIIVAREAKTHHARQDLNTTVLLNLDEPLVIGGINDDLLSIVFKN